MKFNSSASIVIAALSATAEATSTVFPSIPSIPDASDSSGGFMDNISSGGSSNFDESLGLGSSTAASGGDAGASNTAAASSPCCNISQMDGSTCPSGLNLMGGTSMGMGGIFSACCPPGGPSVTSTSNPSCEGFVVPEATTAVPNTDPISSGGFMDDMGSTDNTSASSSASLYCSEEVIQQFPNCKTCLYSCNDGEPKQCSFGFAGDCSPNCVNFSSGGINEEYCLIPSSGSDNMFGDSGNSNDPSSATVHKIGIATVAAVGAAVGYVAMM